jgi:lysozyme family protein
LREKYGKSVHRDVANITDAEVQDIYRHKYWDRVHGDELPGKVADIVFDEAVNQGNGQAIRDIGRALGIRNAPKHWTPEVEARLHQVRNPEELARKIVQLRREDYEDIVHRRPKSRKFLRGWNNRLNNIENYENQNH